MRTNDYYEDEMTEPIFQASASGGRHHQPFNVYLKVKGPLILFRINTGSTVTLVKETTLRHIPALLPPALTFRSYTEQCVDVRGLSRVELELLDKLH